MYFPGRSPQWQCGPRHSSLAAALTSACACAWPCKAASRSAMAARMRCASPDGIGGIQRLGRIEHQTVARAQGHFGLLHCSAVLRLKASSIGLRKASHSFCSWRRSSGTTVRLRLPALLQRLDGVNAQHRAHRPKPWLLQSWRDGRPGFVPAWLPAERPHWQ